MIAMNKYEEAAQIIRININVDGSLVFFLRGAWSDGRDKRIPRTKAEYILSGYGVDTNRFIVFCKFMRIYQFYDQIVPDCSGAFRLFENYLPRFKQDMNNSTEEVAACTNKTGERLYITDDALEIAFDDMNLVLYFDVPNTVTEGLLNYCISPEIMLRGKSGKIYTFTRTRRMLKLEYTNIRFPTAKYRYTVFNNQQEG